MSQFFASCGQYCSFSFSINPSNEYSGLISFRIDWFDFLAVQGTLESSQVPQFEGIDSWHSAFFMVQLLHPYMTTGKTITLTRWAFVGKVLSLLFAVQVCHNFSSKEQGSFNFMGAVTICSDFGAPQKIKSATVSIASPFICHEVMGPDAMILVF